MQEELIAQRIVSFGFSYMKSHNEAFSNIFRLVRSQWTPWVADISSSFCPQVWLLLTTQLCECGVLSTELRALSSRHQALSWVLSTELLALRTENQAPSSEHWVLSIENQAPNWALSTEDWASPPKLSSSLAFLWKESNHSVDPASSNGTCPNAGKAYGFPLYSKNTLNIFSTLCHQMATVYWIYFRPLAHSKKSSVSQGLPHFALSEERAGMGDSLLQELAFPLLLRLFLLLLLLLLHEVFPSGPDTTTPSFLWFPKALSKTSIITQQLCVQELVSLSTPQRDSEVQAGGTESLTVISHRAQHITGCLQDT